MWAVCVLRGGVFVVVGMRGVVWRAYLLGLMCAGMRDIPQRAICGWRR